MFMDAAARLMRFLPPETAHRTTLSLLALAEPRLSRAEADDPRLSVQVLGLDFPNPIGLAAGFDKDALAPDAMLKLGFGFVECGTVTPLPQAGNPRPRLFRLDADRAVINRMGFNNQGVDRMVARLASRPRRGVLGINIGANKDSSDRKADYRRALPRLASFADYIAVNISSPNTPGLRGLQDKNELELLLSLLVEERASLSVKVPLLLKIAPDISLGGLDDIVAVALKSGIEGLIISNTTLARPATLLSSNANQSGGLSGVPLLKPSTALLKETYARVGSKLVLIGVGGVASGADAFAKICAGASLVELYTALVFNGPGLVAKIKRELLKLLECNGIAKVSHAVGMAARPGREL
jgi:dihydroorotate dehydrogenase